MKRFVILMALALASCSDPEVSQIMLRIEAQPSVAAMTRSLEVQIDGGETRGSFRLADTLTLDGNDFPHVIALAPKDDDPSRFFRVVARARRTGVDDPAASVFVQAALIGTYVRGETRTIVLRLEDSCIDVPCGANQDCASSMCREPMLVEPEPADAGTSDMGMSDMGVTRDCTSDVDCDDGIACTTDVCAGGSCQSITDDTVCPAPSNECLLYRCDSLMGCVEEPAANGSPCDNATFCDGSDICTGGSCGPEGVDPCSGSTICDEVGRVCTGCASDADCLNGRVCGPGGICECDGGGVEDCAFIGDEDCDGLADCADPDCGSETCSNDGSDRICRSGSCECRTSAEVCFMGGDEDCDGLFDCDDPDCPEGSACGGGNVCRFGVCQPAFEECSNGIDDDGDSLIDCADELDCDGYFCTGDGGPGMCVGGLCDPGALDDGGTCGTGSFENDFPGSCTDAIDTDCDGILDCADQDCEFEPECCDFWFNCSDMFTITPDAGVPAS